MLVWMTDLCAAMIALNDKELDIPRTDRRQDDGDGVNDPACLHKQVIDLVKLRDRFGPDAPAMEWDLRPKLRCAKCDGVDLVYTPDTSPTGYGKARGG